MSSAPPSTPLSEPPLFADLFAAFAVAAAKSLSASSLPIACLLSDAYRQASTAPRHLQKTNFPPASPTLQKAIHQLAENPPAKSAPLMTQAAQLCPYLKWRIAGGGKAPTLATTELIGPDGIVLSSACRSGFFYQPMGGFYPRHIHAAEELYLQLCGNAVWQADGRAHFVGESGTFVHHQSWQPHAIATDDEPLFALWGWSGDIGLESYAFC